MGFVAKIIILTFNDTEKKAVEEAIAALAEMIPLEAIQPLNSPMLESFLIRPEVLTDDDVMDILKQAFSQTGMKEVVAERVKGRVAGKPLTE